MPALRTSLAVGTMLALSHSSLGQALYLSETIHSGFPLDPTNEEPPRRTA